METNLTLTFFENLYASKPSLEQYIKICESFRLVNDFEVVVISTALLHVFWEIKDYLEFYENEIEKRILSDTQKEFNRINNTVIEKLISDISIRGEVTNIDGRMVLVGKFIKEWQLFEKESGPLTGLS